MLQRHVARTARPSAFARYYHATRRTQQESSVPAKTKNEASSSQTSVTAGLSSAQIKLIRAQLKSQHNEQSKIMDASSMQVGLLDIELTPRWSNLPTLTFSQYYSWFKARMSNLGKSWFTMYNLAKADAIPGVTVLHKFPWSRDVTRMFRLKQHDKSWLNPLLTQSFDQYVALQKAVCSAEKEAIEGLAEKSFRKDLIAKIPNRDPRLKLRWHWRMLSKNAPVECVSVRAFPADPLAHLDIPKNAHHVQMLVKFDTMQSLAVYNRKGELIAGSEKPKRVVDYYVLNARTWLPVPPKFVFQLHQDLTPYKSAPVLWKGVPDAAFGVLQAIKSMWVFRKTAKLYRRLKRAKYIIVPLVILCQLFLF